MRTTPYRKPVLRKMTLRILSSENLAAARGGEMQSNSCAPVEIIEEDLIALPLSEDPRLLR